MSKSRYLSPDVEQYWTDVENVFMQSYGEAGAAGSDGTVFDNSSEEDF